MQGDDHSREGVQRLLLLHALDLIDDCIMERIELGGDFSPAETLQGFGAGIRAVLFHHHDEIALIIGFRKINADFALGRGAHAGDDRIDLSGLHCQREAIPLGLDDDQLFAHLLGNALCHLHVIAIRIASALDGDGGIAGLGLRPVKRRIIALHAHAESLLFSASLRLCLGARARRGLLPSACAQGERQEQCHRQN